MSCELSSGTNPPILRCQQHSQMSVPLVRLGREGSHLHGRPGSSRRADLRSLRSNCSEIVWKTTKTLLFFFLQRQPDMQANTQGGKQLVGYYVHFPSTSVITAVEGYVVGEKNNEGGEKSTSFLNFVWQEKQHMLCKKKSCQQKQMC